MKKPILFVALLSALICAMLFFSSAAQADEIQNPEPKIKPQNTDEHRFNRKLFFTETAVLAASAAFDWTTTAQCQQRGCQEAASRWAIGPFPSNSKIARYGSAWFAADTTALYFAEKSRHKWFRWVGRAYLAYETQDHLVLGFHNRGLCRLTGSCTGKL